MNGNGHRPIKVTATEDERLSMKPTFLLECERKNHPWTEVRNREGIKELEVHAREGNGRSSRISEVAEVERCARCGTRRRLIYSYPDFTFIRHLYDERPEGAKPTYIEGAPRLTKVDKHHAYFARQASSIRIVAA